MNPFSRGVVLLNLNEEEDYIDARVWHALSADDVLSVLEVPLDQSLDSSEIRKRREACGTNQTQERLPFSFWRRLLDQLRGFVVFLLIIAAMISASLEIFGVDEGGLVEADVIMAIVVLNAAIGVIQESKAEEALAALKKMAAPEAHVLRDGLRTVMPGHDLVPGDIVLWKLAMSCPPTCGWLNRLI